MSLRTSLLAALSLSAAAQAAAGPSSQHSAQSARHSTESVRHSAHSAAAASEDIAAAGLAVVAVPFLAVGSGLVVSAGALESVHSHDPAPRRPALGTPRLTEQGSGR